MSYNFGQSAYGAPWQVNSMGNFTVADKVPQEMLFLVDPHWYQFPPSKFDT